MKKLIIFLPMLASILFGFIFLTTGTAHAFDPLAEACTQSAGSGVCVDNAANTGKDKITGSDGVIATIFKWVIRLVGILSVIMIMVGGFRYMTSAGDPSGIKGAKDTILYALVGLLIAGFAGLILRFAVDKITG
jgi:hypothetical protein